MLNISYTIKYNDSYSFVKEVLKDYFQISSRLLLKLKNLNLIFLNGLPTKISTPVHPKDIVSFSLDFDENNSNIISTKMDLNIIYEDDFFLILDKPSNIAVHPSRLHYDNSLSNGVKFYFDSIGLKKKIRPINRLDFNTSGIVVFAKNEYAQEFLIRQMKSPSFLKKYIGILDGVLPQKNGIITAPISCKDNSIIERCVNLNGDTAITHYKILKKLNSNLSFVEFKLETGRTHQIRVHSKYIGAPILGDTLYGNASSLINRQALHSHKIGFIHPISRKYVEFTSPIPLDIKSVICQI